MPYDYDAMRNSWMSGQYSRDPEGIRQWLSAGPSEGIEYGGGDTIHLPGDDANLDIIGNYSGGSGAYGNRRSNWTRVDVGNAGGMGAGPSPNFFQQPNMQMYGNMMGGQGWMTPGMGMQQGGMFNRMYNRPAQMQSRVNPTTGQRFQSRQFNQGMNAVGGMFGGAPRRMGMMGMQGRMQ